MARILGVGVATLDIISEVDSYPPEDSEVRALSRRVVRGGNVTNSLVVLRQLGHACAWAGICADNSDGRYVLDTLGASGVDVTFAVSEANGVLPVSCVTVNRSNGSRTIIHYRDLREYRYSEFAAIEPEQFDWIHFEGRNVEDALRMLKHTRKVAPHARCSVEIEKPRDGIESLFNEADVLLFSRAYANALGITDANRFLDVISAEVQGKLLVCSQGELGAVAQNVQGARFSSPAFPPLSLVDTLGAGDTLNAGIIDGLARGQDLPDVLIAACRLAGRKCGQTGFEGLSDL